MRTEAWWACNICGAKIKRPGSKKKPSLADAFRAHRRTSARCWNAGGKMQQLPQGKPKGK